MYLNQFLVTIHIDHILHLKILVGLEQRTHIRQLDESFHIE